MNDPQDNPEGLPRLVVGVGASAGGLQAFKELLARLPADSGMAFILVQHLDPTHKSLLSELLVPCTRMRVKEAEQGDRVLADTVLVIPPGTNITVEDGRVRLEATPRDRGALRLPIDHLFRSLAEEHGPRAAVIVLTGAGTDGSEGIRAIKAAGGLTIAQDPETSSQTGMPQSAIDTHDVDFVLPIEGMPDILERFASGAAAPPGREHGPGDEDGDDRRAGGDREDAAGSRLSESDIHRLAGLLEARSDFDLRVYKVGTVERRVIRRMTLGGHHAFDAYLDRLRDDDEERAALLRDLLISVTEFYRDPEMFAALGKEIDRIVARCDDEPIRVWVAGCATGEEAYTLAIEFLERIRTTASRCALQIFATDLDRNALEVARAATYTKGALARLPAEVVERYFREAPGGGHRARPLLRNVVSFAVHDLAKDPPFSNMHLVSCRNVMIYLRPKAQEHVLKVLQFALRANGVLVLGTSESPGARRESFATLSKRWRIYQRVGPARALPVPNTSQMRPAGAARRLEPSARGDDGGDRPLHDLVRRVILDARVPASVVVAEDGAILFMHGELRPYLRFPQGESPRLEFSDLIVPELTTRTRAALYRCRKSGETVRATSPRGESEAPVRIVATPADRISAGAVIISFEPEEGDGDADVTPSVAHSPEESAVVEQMEKELQATREDLRNTVEELETSNEELRSSNEESMSMNEELQSANEELEATTEELRSLNEELTTVNAQLREKVDLLERTNDDLSNFFGSTKIATVFLDERLRIKRYTPAAAELLAIEEGDVGRRVDDLAREILQHDLMAEARGVLEHLGARTREIRTEDGRWINRQILPYRTENRRIEGVVVTCVDVTELKETSIRLGNRERQHAVLARLGLSALRESALQGFLDQTVREVQRTLDTDFCKILELQPGGEDLLLRSGVGWREGIVGHGVVGAGLDSQAGFTLQADEAILVDDLAEEKRFSGPDLLVEHRVRSGLSCVIRCGDDTYGVLGAHTRELRRFTNEDANFLQAVAGVIGSAVQQHQSRMKLRIEGSVVKALSEARGREDAYRRLFRVLARELGTCIGEMWRPDDEGGLSCREVFVEAPLQRDEIKSTFCNRRFRSGEGTVGTAYETGSGIWVTATSTEFARREEADRFGILSGVAFPVISGDAVIGVVSAFSRRRLIAEDILLASLESVGRTLGDFLGRRDYEDKAARLAAIAESSHDAIVGHDFEGRITEWLGGAERLYGFEAGDVVGSPMDCIVPESRRDEFQRLSARIRRGEILEPVLTERRTRDGGTLEVSVRLSPIRDREGNVVGVSSTDRDVSRQMDVERRLRDADRQKDEFLAMLGHELRNPLAALSNAAAFLTERGPADPDVEQAYGVLRRQTTHMSKLIDGLLDVSRIIRGKIALERVDLDLARVVRDVAQDVRTRIAGRRVDFDVRVPRRQVPVSADPVRVCQILDNLISNAIKFTQEDGRVLLELTTDADAAVVRVIDDGCGIDPDMLPHVFDVFRQADQSLDRSKGGLGLGLALARSLAELHGGSLEAASEGRDRGAAFTLRLPLREGAEGTAAGAPSLRPLHILIVEDNEDAAAMLHRILVGRGHRVDVATRADEGIRMALATPYEVVLCDIGLPDGKSGFDVARALREGRRGGAMRLVALTGYGRVADRDRCFEAGFDAHLTKPVSLDRITDTLVELGLADRDETSG